MNRALIQTSPPPTGVILTFDIQEVMAVLDPYPVKHYALERYKREENIHPDYALLINKGSVTDQRLAALEHQVVDDFIISTINSFEHTWIQRDLSHLTRRELDYHAQQFDAKQALFLAVQLQPEYAGMYAHYQRIRDSIFLVVPTY